MMNQYANIRNGQGIRGNLLPYGADLAVHHDSTKLGSVKFEAPGLRDVCRIDSPFQMNSNKFHNPGKYTVKAHSSRYGTFTTIVNTCEIEFRVI